MRNVSFSEKFPSSKTSRNSHPSSSPWMECGMPAGKFHRSPSPTSAMKLRPSWSTAVRRARPASMNAHSASLCQCSSRIPPGFRRMFTPASSVATGSSRTVTSRAQPPVSRRLRAAANENLRFGMVPESVSGEASKLGFSRSSGTLRGPSMGAPAPFRTGCGSFEVSRKIWLMRSSVGACARGSESHAVSRETVLVSPRECQAPRKRAASCG
jgi:hypothetical protein